MCKGVDLKPRVTIRLDNNQDMVLRELSESMNVPISILVRTIILDFLTRNSEVLDRIISGEHKINYEELIKENDDDKDDF